MSSDHLKDVSPKDRITPLQLAQRLSSLRAHIQRGQSALEDALSIFKLLENKIVVEDYPIPLETSIMKNPNIKQPPGIEHRIDMQNIEFTAMARLTLAWNVLEQTAVVDDDYPEMRHKYDAAVRDFLEACKKNGRLDRV